MLSLLGAFIVVKLLKGTAQIKSKGWQFGGAAAIFIAMFWLLNKYVPDMRDAIIAEAHARGTQTIVGKTESGIDQSLDVALRPDAQLIVQKDLLRLDRNQFHIEENLNIAIQKPRDRSWEIVRIKQLDVFSEQDVPLIRLLSPLAQVGIQIQDSRNDIFAVRQVHGHEVIVDKQSEIAAVPVTFNPFSSNELIKAALDAQRKVSASLLDSSRSASEDEVNKAQKEIMARVESHLNTALPLTKILHNGIYVTEIDIKGVTFIPGMEVLTKGMSNLDKAILIDKSARRNLKIDQLKGLFSYDGSTKLGKVIIDGERRDAILNDIGFILAGPTRVISVKLICLDIDGLAVSMMLKRLLDSLLFAG